jgi:hypothetical protein
MRSGLSGHAAAIERNGVNNVAAPNSAADRRVIFMWRSLPQ